MRIIKVDAIESTNTFLRNLYRSNDCNEITAVIANQQTAGRGQKGTIWQSQIGENLTCSILIPDLKLQISRQFDISIVVSLILLNVLNLKNVPNLSVKWPNDILSDSKKIAGILIENIVAETYITATIIGIGLNVNQTIFENLPKASSLRLIKNKSYEIESIFAEITDVFQERFRNMLRIKFDELRKSYETYLFKKGKVMRFKTHENLMLTGVIRGINSLGQLEILSEDGSKKNFNLKEISLFY